MKTLHLVIDGYSLLHRMPEAAALFPGNLTLARQKVLRLVEPVSGLYAPRTTLVFDGREIALDPHHDHAAVEVIFTGAGHTADSYIERFVHDSPHPESVQVVTSDRAEINTVLAAGGQVMTCREFIDLCGHHAKELTRRARTTRTRGHSLGDYFP